MQELIVESFNDTLDSDYESFDEIKTTTVEIVQTWL